MTIDSNIKSETIKLTDIIDNELIAFEKLFNNIAKSNKDSLDTLIRQVNSDIKNIKNSVKNGTDGVDGISIKDISLKDNNLVIELTNNDIKTIALPKIKQIVSSGGGGYSKKAIQDIVSEMIGSSGTVDAYTKAETDTLIANAIDGLVNGASNILDTFGEVESVLTTLTTQINANSQSIANLATAQGESLASGSILRFGTFDITIGATASKGATTLTVSGVASDMATGTVLKTYDGKEIILNGAVASGATSITVYPLDQSIITGSKIKVERFAVLTASASASATSLTVSSLTVGIPASTVAPFYNQMYAVGSNATVMYRYTVGTNVWSTTSSNTSNPAIPAVTGAIGAGCAIKWLPSISTDKLYILRGGATANIYTYSLSGNTFATETFYPTTETFTTGTCVAVRSVGGVQKNIYIQKDNTGRVYKYNAITKQLEPFMTQWIYPAGTAYVGDRVCILTSPDGVDFLYLFVTGTQAVVRYALIDS